MGKLTMLDMTPLGWLGLKNSTHKINIYCNVGKADSSREMSALFSLKKIK